MAIKERPLETSQASKLNRRITGLDWLILAGLVASFAAFLYSALSFLALFLTSGNIAPPFIITSAASILLAIGIGVMLTGWRWSNIVMLVVTVLSLLGLANPYIPYTVTHPSTNLTAFATFATIFASSALILVAAIAKIIRTNRREPNEISRSMVGYTGLVAGVLAGVLLLGFTAQGATGTGGVNLTPKNENVTVQGAAFAPDIVALHTGDTLTITDTDGIHHILTNGTWSSGKPAPGMEQGAVTLNNLNIDNGSVKVGPFITPGVYHIYCTIHPGMNLTVVVQ
jgi:plastocyanin